MKYTLGTASKATGKSKSTLSRDIKNGKISAVRQDDGSYRIDPAELHRVYPPVSFGVAGNGSIERSATGFDTHGNPTFQREAEVLREVHDRERRQLERTIDDLRADRDHWRQQATALLTDQRPAARTSGNGWRYWLAGVVLALALLGLAGVLLLRPGLVPLP